MTNLLAQSTANTATLNTPDDQISYEYDSKTGQHKATVTPNTRLEYTYNDREQLDGVKTTTVNGAAPASPIWTSYTYDLGGNLSTVTQSNGSVTTYSYDTLNRLYHDEMKKGTATLFSQTYTTRSDGQRLKNDEFDAGDNETLVTWNYDALNRLTSEVYDGPGDNADSDYTDVFTYDYAGNRLTKTHDAYGNTKDESIGYTYNARDELTSEAHTPAGSSTYTVTYTYDANGSQTCKSHPGVDTVTSTWDLRNRMVKNVVNGVISTYTYNSDGVRVSEKATYAGPTTYYLNDPQNPTGHAKAIEEAATYGSSRTPTRTYTLGLAVESQTDATISGGVPTNITPKFFLHDGHGSTRALLDTTGAIITGQVFNYASFGDAIGFNAATAQTPWLFGGDGLYDSASGYTYHLARFRDGHRFTAADDFAGLGNLPQKNNKFVYVSNNPFHAWDPSGNVEFTIPGIGTTFYLSNYQIALGVVGLGLLVGIGTFVYLSHVPVLAGVSCTIADLQQQSADFQSARSKLALTVATHKGYSDVSQLRAAAGVVEVGRLGVGVIGEGNNLSPGRQAIIEFFESFRWNNGHPAAEMHPADKYTHTTEGAELWAQQELNRLQIVIDEINREIQRRQGK